MDEEVAESMDLGVMLAVATATLLIMAVVCAICRKAFIQRDEDIKYENSIIDKFTLEDLHIKNIGTGAELYGVELDNVLKWSADNGNSYYVCILVPNPNNPAKYKCYSTMELTLSEQTKLANNFDVGASYFVQNVSPYDFLPIILDDIQANINKGRAFKYNAITTIFESRTFLATMPELAMSADYVQRCLGLNKIPEGFQLGEGRAVIVFQIQ